VAQEYRAIVQCRAPQVFVRKIEFPDGRLPIIQEAVRLPLSQDGRAVDHIVSVTDWSRPIV